MARRRKTGGRVRGTPNKTTAALKEMVLAALDKAGGVKYLTARARDEPRAFLALLGRVLPLQVTGDGGGPVLVVTGVLRDGDG